MSAKFKHPDWPEISALCFESSGLEKSSPSLNLSGVYLFICYEGEGPLSHWFINIIP